jgi:peroxiredoxin
MKNRFLFLIIFFAVLCGCTSGETPRPGAQEKLAVNSAAPDFRLKDLSGKDVSLNSLRDGPVLLVFGTTWCPYCREEIPRMKEIQRLGREKNLEVLNIYINESAGKVADFAAKYALPYRVLLDRDGRVAERYQVHGVPMLVLVDRQGKIVCHACRNVETLIKGL